MSVQGFQTPRASTSKVAYRDVSNVSSPIAGHKTGEASSSYTREGKGKSNRPKVLFMGPRSGGKSSIRKVVFERMAPSDTLFIEKNAKFVSDDINSFISMDIWDLPGGHLDPEQWNLSFETTDAVVFVLDAQSTINDIVRKLAVTMNKAFIANPGIQFEIFLHKIDGMSEDYRLDTLQNLRDRLTEELFDLSPALESSMNVFYHLTSVFDTTIYEALSKVIQKLIPEQAMFERLLDLLCQQCSMDKAFLFDTSSKIYIAADSSPLDNQTYVICSDYLDLVGDFTLLYETNGEVSGTLAKTRRSSSSGSRANGLAPMSKQTDSSPQLDLSSGSALPGVPGVGVSGDLANSVTSGGGGGGATVHPSTTKRLASSKVKLGTGATIAQWGVNKDLSLVALLPPHVMDQHSALIDYNVSTFRDAVLAIFDLELGQSKE